MTAGSQLIEREPRTGYELPALTWDKVVVDPAFEARLKAFGLETVNQLGILSLYALEEQLAGSAGVQAWRLLLDFKNRLEGSLILRPWSTTLEMSSSHLDGLCCYECSLQDGEDALSWRVKLESQELEDIWPRIAAPPDLLDRASSCASASWNCQQAADFVGHTAVPCLLDHSTLAETLQALTPREREVVVLRFGLEDGQSRTLEEIGFRFNLTRERIRQIEARALNVLRHPTRIKALKAVGERVSHLAELLAIGPDTAVFAKACSGAMPSSEMNPGSVLGLLKGLGQINEDARPTLHDFESRVLQALTAQSGRVPTDEELAAPDMDVVRSVMTDDAVVEVLQHWPRFAPYGRLKLVVPALAESGDDRVSPRALRLGALIGVVREAGMPLHYSDIAERLNASLPAQYRMTEHNVHAWLSRYTDKFVWAGPGSYGLKEWDVGRRIDRELIPMPEQLLPRRRRGIAEEIALLLLEAKEPLPLSDIEDHVLSRFRVMRASVRAAVEEDAARRFRRYPGGRVGLKAWGGGPQIEPPRSKVKRRIRKEELQSILTRAENVTAHIRRAVETGGARIPATRLFGWLVLAASLRERDELASLVRFPAIRKIPKESLETVLRHGADRGCHLLSGTETNVPSIAPSRSVDHVIASVPLPSNERVWRFSKARKEARRGPDALTGYVEQLVPGSTRCQYAIALMEAITKAGFTRNERTGEWVPPR